MAKEMRADDARQRAQRRCAPFELRGALDAQTGDFSGWASVFGVVDDYGTVFERGCFEKSLAAHRARDSVPAMLWQHDFKEPIGRWLTIEERAGGPNGAGGLFVRGRLELRTRKGAEAAALLIPDPKPALSGLSIGFLPVRDEMRNGALHFLEVELFEVSLVTFPAQDYARVERTRQNIDGAWREFGLLHDAMRAAWAN